MKIWRIAGRFIASPPPSDWKARLASRVGERPRRLGDWAELALFGAIGCLDAAGESGLPHAALLSVGSVRGPDKALRHSLLEAQDGLPLPIGFLNSQPNQVLPALARYLGWQGNGRCLTTRDPLAALRLACLEAGPAGVLIGWVDEDAPGRSVWFRLITSEADETRLRPGQFEDLGDPDVGAIAFAGGELLVARFR